MWLSEQEVQSLTRRKRTSAQIRVLVEAGIPFLLVDGRPIVVKTHVSPASEKRVRRL